MKQEIKEQWTGALRSGDYNQGTGHLREGDGYCCLGVLCDLAVKAGVIPEPSVSDSGVYTYCDAQRSRYYLPHAVRLWAELDSDNPTVRVQGGNMYLAELNDDGVPFDEIADHIDANL